MGKRTRGYIGQKTFLGRVEILEQSMPENDPRHPEYQFRSFDAERYDQPSQKQGMKRSNSEAGFLAALDDIAKSYDFSNLNFCPKNLKDSASGLLRVANSGQSFENGQLNPEKTE